MQEPRNQQVPLLDRLDAAEREVVERDAQVASYPPGEPICLQGDPADRFYVLLEGEVCIERDGEQIASLGPAAFFGESGLLMRGRRCATVRASTPARVWSVGSSVFQRVLCHHLLAEEHARRAVLMRIEDAPAGSFR